MNKSLIQQFADYAATRNGPFETCDNRKCPMADFGHHLWPAAHVVRAGEFTITGYDKYDEQVDHIEFADMNFFRHFIEHCPSWEELTLRLRRAAV